MYGAGVAVQLVLGRSHIEIISRTAINLQQFQRSTKYLKELVSLT
jgi:hypothetical protein